MYKPDSKTGLGRGTPREATSDAVRSLGLKPAFEDTLTGNTYPSRFENGSIAPFHYLGGLPESLIASRDANGQPATIQPWVIPGFLQQNRFYTRREAADLLRSVREDH